jgi:hypothetical protein
VLLPLSEYVLVPNADFPSLRSLSVNVHAPVPPGTDNVGESEVDAHDDGVTTAPKYNGVRSPVPGPAGSATSVVGSPADSPAAERFSESEDEHDVARSASERPTAISETEERRHMGVSGDQGESNGVTVSL